MTSTNEPIGAAQRRTGANQTIRVVLVPSPRRLTVLDYSVPASLGQAAAGMRVLVPLGTRRSMGVVISVEQTDAADDRLRDILAILDSEPVLDAELLQLVQWISQYYLVPLSDAVATALPGALRIETERLVEVVDGEAESCADGPDGVVLRWLAEVRRASITTLQSRFGANVRRTVARLERRGAVTVVERLRRESTPTRRVRLYAAAVRVDDRDPRIARRPALGQLYLFLRDLPGDEASVAELRRFFPNVATKLRQLTEAGLVRFRDEERYRSVLPRVDEADRGVVPNDRQQVAVERITATLASGFQPFLLWGVTGSGKTEVYLRAAAAARAMGRTVLMLVPEISLTHQLVRRVRARFGDQIAVLHSQLSDGERWDEWRRIARGEVGIVVGARSAVFAPLPRLGLIVVDEEHDGAYKQSEGARYHGRDVAVMRAKLVGCSLVLGSATPSIETFANAQSGRYGLLELPERVEARLLPPIRLVDLRNAEAAVSGPLSPLLRAAIEANLAAGGQTLLFLNRRGFANFLQCRACGEPVSCPNCSVTLTLHGRGHSLRCHYCDHTVRLLTICPECGEAALQGWGVGTEQLEAMLKQSFPGARIARMDKDTTRRKGSLAKLLDGWSSAAFDILIGTQMVTKGHDVPGVTLVGVVSADLSLNFPDFRAAERTFQLLAQVAGRAGRGDRAGQVIVQTLQPGHFSLQEASRHDFLSFARRELASRRELNYPPFSRMILLRVEGEDFAAVEQTAGELAASLRLGAEGRLRVLGPATAPLERLRRRHRFQIHLRSDNGADARRVVASALEGFHTMAASRGVRVVVDVDPYDML